MSKNPKYQWKPVFWVNNWFENYKEKNIKNLNQTIEANV